MKISISKTLRAALVVTTAVATFASIAQAAPASFAMSGSFNFFDGSIFPRPNWNPTSPQLSFTLPGFAPVNALTGHVLVVQNTGVAQPTLSIPREALAEATRTRGIAVGQFGPHLLQLTTRNPVAWPQRGVSPAFDGTGPLVFQTRPGTVASPSTFTWCPSAGFACTGAFDTAASPAAAIHYTKTPGKSRFGGTGGLIRRAPFDGSLGGNLAVRVGAIPVQNPTSYSTVAAFSPISALGAPVAGIDAAGAGPVGAASGMTLGKIGVFYSINATSMGVITKRAPSPVMTPSGGTLFGAQLNNTRWGAPNTTGMITMSATKNAAGNSVVRTYTGFDNRTPGGLGTVVLVAGGLRSGASNEQALASVTTLTLSPEPALMVGAGAALAALLGGAIVTNRRRR